jgi:hypothetical protein
MQVTAVLCHRRHCPSCSVRYNFILPLKNRPAGPSSIPHSVKYNFHSRTGHLPRSRITLHFPPRIGQLPRPRINLHSRIGQTSLSQSRLTWLIEIGDSFGFLCLQEGLRRFSRLVSRGAKCFRGQNGVSWADEWVFPLGYGFFRSPGRGRLGRSTS